MMDSIKVLVTGSKGQVGKKLVELIAAHPKLLGIFTSRDNFDLANPDTIQKTFEEAKPDILINAGAYTQVDQAETEQDLAMQINSRACLQMAQLCAESSIPLIHFSSDYVYHNDQNRPLIETDMCHPQSVYAKSKKEGEDGIRSNHDAHYIIRTSWVYDESGKNFVNTMLALAAKHDRLTVVDDQIGTPTYAGDLARLCIALIEDQFGGSKSAAYGTYNFSNEGVCSWYDFANAIFEIAGITITVLPVDSSAFPRPASRPHYSVMNKAKIRAALPEFSIPHWKDSLVRCLNNR